MKNLENYGVISLPKNEMQITNGGAIIILGVAVSGWVLAGGAAATIAAAGVYMGYQEAAEAAE